MGARKPHSAQAWAGGQPCAGMKSAAFDLAPSANAPASALIVEVGEASRPGLNAVVARQRKSRHDGGSTLETLMSTAVYTANVLTSARMAAGMTSRARRPLNRHSAG